jgi:hypothetical protein
LKEFLLNDDAEKQSSILSPDSKPFAAKTRIEFPTFKEMIENTPGD